ncbi:hypothetical protein BH10BAC5_BH10BAC5_29040 [soil metagenome]
MLLFLTENIKAIKEYIRRDEESEVIYPAEIPEIEKKYEFLKELLKSAAGNDVHEFISLLSGILGVLSSKNYKTANYEKCREFVMEKMEIDESNNNIKGLSRCYSIVGNLYLDFGDIPRSLNMHLKRLDISRKLNDKNGIAISLTNIANAEMINMNYDESLKYNKLAIEAYKEISVNDSKYASLLGNLGQSYYFINEYDKALEYFLQAIEIKKNDDDYSKSSILNMIGGVYADNKKYDLAFEYFNKALESSRKLNDRNTELNILLAIANTYERLGNPDKGIEIILKTIEDNSELSNELIFSAHYYSLYEFYKQKGDNEKAFKSFREFIKLDEKIELQSAERVISNLKNLHELENIKIHNRAKELRNEQLKNTLFKLEKVNEELSKTNLEKNELLSVIAHDLRNPVSNIKLLADIHSNDTEIKEIELDVMTDTELISATCEDVINILNELVEPETKKLPDDKKYGSFDIIKLLNRSIFLFKLNTATKKLQIKLNSFDTELLIKSDYRSVYQIIDNILSNSIKFSPSGSLIDLRVQRVNDQIILNFKDQAGGFSDSDIEKYFKSEPGRLIAYKDPDSERFGLSIVQKLLEKIRGKVSCRNYEENGIRGSIIEVMIPDHTISIL